MSCPFANAFASIDPADDSHASACPFHAHIFRSAIDFSIEADSELDIVVRGGTHEATPASAALLEDIGGPDRIREMCCRFYAHAFLDKGLQQFFFLDDGAEAHGKRLADWIIEKMDSNNKAWTASGRLGQRQPSHHKAWNSSKRAPEVRGDHFNLKDTRLWMRIHFWAARECQLHLHKPFWRWYCQFIGHFVRVYERYAPRFVEESCEWSASSDNIARYLENGYVMEDDNELGKMSHIERFAILRSQR
jgi:hypothetical protein